MRDNYITTGRQVGRSRAAQQAFCDQFNEQVPVGTMLRYWRGEKKGEPSGVGKMHHKATMMGGHTAVAWIEDCSGAIALTHVEVVT